jgi:hypothetical protein
MRLAKSCSEQGSGGGIVAKRTKEFMRQQLEVIISEQSRLPVVRIPDTHIWDLVDFLSIQRICVSYTYDASGFTVAFLHSDQECAQCVINEWANSQFASSAG